jgi:cytoskeleton protein RodZ
MNDVAGSDQNDALTAGQQLARARTACGFGVADVARHLKLSPVQVEAMEAGEYGRLPGPVFVRGFIRNYARLVKLDPEPLLVSTERVMAPELEVEPKGASAAEIPLPTGRESKWHRYVIVLAVLATPVLIYEFSREEAPQVTVKSRQTAVPELPARPVEKAEAPATAVASNSQERAGTSAGGEAPAAKPARTDPPAVKAGERMAAKDKPGERVVRLVFNKESWVELRDRDGRTLLYQLNPAGSEQAISGSPPLSLVVGNATSVRLTVNDQPVDLGRHTRGDDVARVTLE